MILSESKGLVLVFIKSGSDRKRKSVPYPFFFELKNAIGK